MPQGDDAGVHPDAQGGLGWAGAWPAGQTPFLGSLFLASAQTRSQRGPQGRARQSLQELEQRLLGDLAASAFHAGEARQPPALAEAQGLGLERLVVGEAPGRGQARGAQGPFRRHHRRHRFSAGARRSFRHRAGRLR